MRRRQPRPSSSSSDSDGSDTESCFDIKDKYEQDDTDTELTDGDTDINDCEGGDEADLADLAWIDEEDNAYPPEFYLVQENNSDESDNEYEDYSDNSILLLDMIEARFHRYIPFSLISIFFFYRIVDLTLSKGIVNIQDRIRPRRCELCLFVVLGSSSVRC